MLIKFPQNLFGVKIDQQLKVIINKLIETMKKFFRPYNKPFFNIITPKFNLKVITKNPIGKFDIPINFKKQKRKKKTLKLN